jgi:hypothetical protein
MEDTALKRISLSREEKDMNGAPEGEIFEVKFTPDELLPPFEDSAISSVIDSLSQPNERLVQYSWHERYDLVELSRRLVYHHSTLISPSSIPALFELALLSINSLRSAEVRNAIFSILNLLVKCNLPNSYPTSSSSRAFGALLGRTASSPKFLSDLALSAVNQICDSLPPVLAIQHILLNIHLKHATIFNNMILLLNKTTMKLDKTQIAESSPILPVNDAGGADKLGEEAVGDQSGTLLSQLIVALYDGLSSKKAEGKIAARLALAFINSDLLDENTLLDSFLTSEQMKVVNLEFSRMTKSGKSLNHRGVGFKRSQQHVDLDAVVA